MTSFIVGKHPEIKDVEYLLSNVVIGDEWMFGFFKDRQPINGRLGNIAYDNMGYVMPNHIPVIVKEKIE